MNTICVIGSTGFLGSSIVRYFSKIEDVRVLAVARDLQKARALFNDLKDNVSIIADPNNDLKWLNSYTDFQAIVNVAGYPIYKRWSGSVKNKIIDSRVKLTRKLVNALVNTKASVDLLISTSAIGYYGIKAINVKEDYFKGEGILHDMCVEWERAALEAENAGIDVAILRNGIVLGDGGLLRSIIRRFGSIAFYIDSFNDTNYLSWIDIRDYTRVIDFILTKRLKGTFNVANGVETKFLDLKRAVSDAAKSHMLKLISMKVSSSMLKLLFGDIYKELFEANQYVIPENLAKNGFSFEYKDITATVSDFI
ncbi:MAG: epimerase [Candidatus Micrarchaeota archaeon]|nr:MAG: epimerase [Candidatus Micrarchaeota archaeon]